MIKKLSHSTIFRVAALMALVSLTSIISLVSSVYLSDTFESDTQLIYNASALTNAVHRVEAAKSRAEYQRELAVLRAEWQVLSPLQRNALMSAELRYTVARLDERVSNIRALSGDADANYQQLQEEELETLAKEVQGLLVMFQRRADQSASLLRLIQSLSLFVTVVVISFSLLIMRRDVELPLNELTRVARGIAAGDLEQEIKTSGRGELALLARAFSEMRLAVSLAQSGLEERVAFKTEALKRANDVLTLMSDMTLYFAQFRDQHPQLEPFVGRLSKMSQIGDVEVCLVTAAGEMPFEQLNVGHAVRNTKSCDANDCNQCTRQTTNHINDERDGIFVSQFVLANGELYFGVLTVRSDLRLKDWQLNMFRSVSAHLATGLSLKRARERSRRIALLKERGVIARELHDSLAQALSYLRIQVVRMDKSFPGEKTELQQSILNELNEGLSSAYRELRELLTTFRLKIEGQTIEQALRETVEKLQSRNESIAVSFNFGITGIPLTPHEEIHLLQIGREAIQNAFYHSRGNHIEVMLIQDETKHIRLVVRDNGDGIDLTQEKLNHYGMAIMSERSRDLNGDISVQANGQSGTEIALRFLPRAFVGDNRLIASSGN